MLSEIVLPAPGFEHKTIFVKLFLDPHGMCNSFPGPFKYDAMVVQEKDYFTMKEHPWCRARTRWGRFTRTLEVGETNSS